MINLSSVALLDSLSDATVNAKAQRTIDIIHSYTLYPIINRIEFLEDVTQNDILSLIALAKRSHDERADMKRIENIDICFVRLCGLFLCECLGVPCRVMLYVLFLQLPLGAPTSSLSASSSTPFLHWNSILLCASLTGLWLLALTTYISQLYVTRKAAFPLNYYLNHLAVSEWYKHSRAFWNHLASHCNPTSTVGSDTSDTASSSDAIPTPSSNNSSTRHPRSIKLHLNELQLNHEIVSSQYINRLLCDDASKFELHILVTFTACVLVSFVNLFQLHHSIPYFYSYMASAFSLVVLCSFLAVSLGSRLEPHNATWYKSFIIITMYGCCITFAFLLALKVEEQIPLVDWSTIFLPFSVIGVLGFSLVYLYACVHSARMAHTSPPGLGSDKERSASSPSNHSSAIALYRSSHYGMHSSSSSASLELPRSPIYQWKPLLFQISSYLFIFRLILIIFTIVLFQCTLFGWTDASRGTIAFPLFFSELPFMIILLGALCLLCLCCCMKDPDDLFNFFSRGSAGSKQRKMRV